MQVGRTVGSSHSYFALSRGPTGAFTLVSYCHKSQTEH